MKLFTKYCYPSLIIFLLLWPCLIIAKDGYKAYDDAQAIERDSQNATSEAEKGNYESAREDASLGFDTPTTLRNDSNNYDIPEPDPKIED